MKEYTLVRGLLDSRKRNLVIDENFIKFENKDQRENLFTVINKEDIAGIRYGIHFINGYSMHIGREYQIFIRTKSENELKISFKLFYKRKLNKKHQMFCDMINDVWNYYFHAISQSYLDKYFQKESFDLAGITVLHDKI